MVYIFGGHPFLSQFFFSCTLNTSILSLPVEYKLTWAVIWFKVTYMFSSHQVLDFIQFIHAYIWSTSKISESDFLERKPK